MLGKSRAQTRKSRRLWPRRSVGGGNSAQSGPIMNERSHVSMERCVCVACGAEYDTGALLIDKRLRASLEHYTTTGWGLCPEHQRLFDEGFVALVECDPERGGASSHTDVRKSGQAFRTGRIAHIRRELFGRAFNVHIKPETLCVFVFPGVIDRLQTMMPS
ncbi:MAG: ATPase [Gammaproteobacteria bacterium]|nr:ATPase [Gammaproteobacteria bacterium]